MQDVLRLYAFSALLQILIFIPFAVRAPHFGSSARSIITRVLDAFLHAAPPGLPAVMLFCGGFARGRLAKQGIHLVFPDKLGRAAGTTVVAFDKTGTLTGTVVRPLPILALLTAIQSAHLLFHTFDSGPLYSPPLGGGAHRHFALV